MKTRRTVSVSRQASGAIPSPAAVVSRAPRRGAGAAPRECAASGTRQGRAQAGISCARPVVKSARKLDVSRIHCGLDFVKVSLWLEWSEDSHFLERLELRKQYMQQTKSDELAPISAGGMDWNLARTGAKYYAYRLLVGDVALLLSRDGGSGGDIPSARLEIGSLTSQTDLLATLVRVRHFLKDVGAKIVREHVGELHLAADFIGVDIRNLGLFDQNRWISKARHFTSHYEFREFTGCQLGRGDFVLRCYDKVRLLKEEHHKQSVFAGLWGVEKFDELPVTRVEFQLRRPVLKQFQLECEGFALGAVDTVLNSLASIWRYCSGVWARFADAAVDRVNKNQLRTKLSAFWRKVKSVSWVDLFQFERKSTPVRKDEERLRRQAVGLLMSIAAFHVEDVYDLPATLKEMLRFVREDVTDFQDRNEGEFVSRMMIKRNAALLEV